MAGQGFTVTKHYLGLETAWRAEFSQGTGGRVIGVNAEMDALEGMGHACGHNLIAISGVGIAVAMKAALQSQQHISGKVVLLGTPGMLKYFTNFWSICIQLDNDIYANSAEESGGGKVILLERGGYADMDACIMYDDTP